MKQKIISLWNSLYKNEQKRCDELLMFLENERSNSGHRSDEDVQWYKDAVVYSLYVDLFAGNFSGLTEKLPYLQTLGVNTVWLLPVLDSPMKDQGFDVSDYYSVRSSLGGNEQFFEFIRRAHAADMRIIFDIAVNHTSSEHEWFKSACSSRDSVYRDFYIWNDNDQKYKDARLLFKGMVNSNWEYNSETGDYYFHRFYEFQPDLNYRNPAVIVEMIKILVFWKQKGIDGLRMDAIPFIWKEDETECENLPQGHSILKLFRICLDYIQEGTFLIAEANLSPCDVVQYFGNGDECQAAYHFPLMPQIFMSIADSNSNCIRAVLSESVTPPIPESCCWMTFLRCHDELTLEFVDEHERKRMNEVYLHGPEFTFRNGEGIAGRLYFLFQGDIRKILLAFSVLFSLNGSPVLYYGDEIAADNNRDFFLQKTQETGYSDARFFNRGPMDWTRANRAIVQSETNEYRVFHTLCLYLKIKKKYRELWRQQSVIQDSCPEILYIEKRIRSERVQFIHNLGNTGMMSPPVSGVDLLTGNVMKGSIYLRSGEMIWVYSD